MALQELARLGQLASITLSDVPSEKFKMTKKATQAMPDVDARIVALPANTNVIVLETIDELDDVCPLPVAHSWDTLLPMANS